VFSSTNPAALRAGINHVLGQHAWARQLLRPHAGKTVRLRTGLPTLPLLGRAPEPCFRISEAGALDDPGADSGQANVTISLPADQWFAGMAAVQRAAKVEGDAELALVLGKIVQHMRWDPAEDIARWTGDAAAQTLVTGLRNAASAAKSVLSGQLTNAAQALGAKEQSPLVGATQWSEYQTQAKQMTDSLERLERRLASKH
jgi:ubiquinone biosynthesis accessory factor UbiJ